MHFQAFVVLAMHHTSALIGLWAAQHSSPFHMNTSLHFKVQHDVQQRLKFQRNAQLWVNGGQGPQAFVLQSPLHMCKLGHINGEGGPCNPKRGRNPGATSSRARHPRRH